MISNSLKSRYVLSATLLVALIVVMLGWGTYSVRNSGQDSLDIVNSRRLAQLLGGDLTAASVEGEGSTFTLSLPLQYGQQRIQAPLATPDSPLATPDSPPATLDSPLTAPDSPRASRHSPLILAIDDNPDVVAILQENLADAGYEVLGALTAADGLAKAQELRPSAITLDIVLPDRDGWQVLHDLKANPATREIPVIMLTIVDNKAMGFRLGAADYLVKPMDSAALLATLARIAPIEERPARLLVVDDDPDVHDMVKQLLEERPYVVQSVADGLAALEQIEEDKPDAILLDLMMPRLDGFSTLAQLRQNQVTMDIPVIILTAKSLTAAETAVLQASAQQIVLKQGLASIELLEVLRHILESG